MPATAAPPRPKRSRNAAVALEDLRRRLKAEEWARRLRLLLGQDPDPAAGFPDIELPPPLTSVPSANAEPTPLI
jgi:hypothetical protein